MRLHRLGHMCFLFFLLPLHVASMSAIGSTILVVFQALLTAMVLPPLLRAPLSAPDLVSGHAHVASSLFPFWWLSLLLHLVLFFFSALAPALRHAQRSSCPIVGPVISCEHPTLVLLQQWFCFAQVRMYQSLLSASSSFSSLMLVFSLHYLCCPRLPAPF